MSVSFIDRDYRVTPAEKAAWSFYLSLPAPLMRPAKRAFRSIEGGVSPSDALTRFVLDSGVTDADMLGSLWEALEGLAGNNA
ncbi:MAG: hypothetical protein HIU92_02550 [Proteobacteria bacterium]|nr:hypothetical protein [Pseudomonadota bacterium]